MIGRIETGDAVYIPSLRELIAIASLGGIQANPGNNERNFLEDVRLAVDTADAMIAELAREQIESPAERHKCYHDVVTENEALKMEVLRLRKEGGR